ncbi:hypothetical protein H4O05_09845 [Citrobacter freundii]|uniref:hypothetical protein n=1 Tax=Citrobacter freundii TaxID=546 RepID=UPI0016271F07|nr:hypothetical protein [Citrobacter freundii]UNM04983.1 hypothetical protein H4O05_09845 [Citrobacter freundii]
MKIQAGGPAFPYQLANRSDSTMKVFGVDLPSGKTADFGGMSLLDYFAASAICQLPPPNDYVGNKETEESYRKWANKAYKMADAMLRAREES